MRHVDFLRSISEATGILVWKASVFAANEKQTQEAINDLRSADTRFRLRAAHRTGFVARPYDKSFDHIGKRIEEAFRKRKVQATEYRPIAGHPFVVQEMVDQINYAHFGIADITALNDNVLIEAGVMIGNGMPLVILKRKDDDMPLPFDIAARQCYRYELKGEDVVIHDATKTRHLDEFIVDFIDRMPSKEFWEAGEWFGG